MNLSSRQLRALASDVDDLHHDGMRAFREQSAEIHLDAYRASRRRFLAGSAGVLGVVTAGSMLSLPGARVRRAGAAGLDDKTIAGYAQSVELAAVAAYTAAAGVLSAGTKPVAELFLSHHQQHADAFGSVAGDKAATGPNAKLVATTARRCASASAA